MGDVYSWELTNPSGDVVFSRDLGTPGFSYTFSTPGVFQLKLELKRGNLVVATETKPVEVLPSPEVLLENEYIICTGQNLTLSAIDPSSEDFDDYVFEWKDSGGNVISNSNEATINSPGTYSVEFYFENSLGENECVRTLTTNAVDLDSFSLIADKSVVCTTQFIEFETSPSIEGNWYVQRQGETARTFLGTSSDFSLFPSRDLPSPGDYQMIFELPNPNNPGCTAELIQDFTYNPEPRIVLEEAFGASDCSLDDGILRIRALTDVDRVSIDSLGISQGPFVAGQIIDFPGLKSGAYTLSTSLGSCSYSIGTVVPLSNPIPELEFEIIDILPETCSETGKLPGGFSIVLKNGPTVAGYQVISERGIPFIAQDTTELNDTIRIDLGGGKYFFEIFDGEGCAQPEGEEIEIPGLSQVNFSVPTTINVCQSFELFPNTSQPLEFLMTDPDGIETIFEAGDFGLVDKAGTYHILGRIPGQDVLCPFLREFNVNLVEPIDFEPRLIEEDCFGNRVYEADIFGVDPSTAQFTWLDENDEVVSRGQFLIPVTTGEFKLDVQPINAQACPIPPKTFIIEEPVLEVDITFTQTKLCEFGPEATVNLESTFPEAITDIRWRRFNEDGSVEELIELTDLKVFQTRIPGTYEASLFRFIPGISVEECELGRATVQLDLTPEKVAFDIPSELTICERFDLTPDTNQELDFIISTPSDSIIEISTGESIVLDQTGVYTFLAFDQNSPTPFCPEQKEILVSRVQPVVYEPVLVEEFCDGSSLYSAELQNYAAEDVVFFWRDNTGNLLGQAQTLTITNPGTYSLEVQPTGSTPCEISPIEFEIAEPVLSVDVSLTSEPFCPDAISALVTVQSDFEQITTIEWWFTDPDGNQRQLNDLTNEREISASLEGTYEARVFNETPCLLGRDEILILRSQDEVRPDVDSVYQICPRLEIAPEINPGNFASYEWYFEDQLVSTSPTFKPLQKGNFDLIVTSLEGCTYSASFETEEECELRVQFPTAITPQDNQKPFLIYTNYLVDELELWIFNQWGELIFHCKNDQLITEESTCLWDGTYRGEKIPNGAYSIRINLVNYEKNINKTQLGSLMVID